MAALIRGIRRVSLSSVFNKKSLPALSYSNETTIATDEEQATGLEKKELTALVAGVEDPFNMNVQKVPGGTKEKPQLVPSMYPERIVGCICDDDAVTVLWMTVKKGPPQRCDCGHWFQLTEGNPIKFDL